jgi:hypothetical protein
MLRRVKRCGGAKRNDGAVRHLRDGKPHIGPAEIDCYQFHAHLRKMGCASLNPAGVPSERHHIKCRLMGAYPAAVPPWSSCLDIQQALHPASVRL